ncbi:SET domain protein, putative [Plasmodium ovale curtisi]|uniref:SET domain protein, putative n=1 Tax=Plasmodium ovale curtisi TaxID=864141 RepID=A0A1A8VKM8_PLAOA|nr:SET domain protein, putative [Plasmodium ovale curtisi]SBS80169.1 SET domain protein, putative [Plasmodium ovale curtisi]SBS93794.1 SET domain protein, putative [Plasmodium ovale curtisi]
MRRGTTSEHAGKSAGMTSDKFRNVHNSFVNSASVIWIEKEKLDSVINIPLYTDVSTYFEDLSKHPSNQGKRKDYPISKIFFLFDDNSCNIAVDISVRRPGE